MDFLSVLFLGNINKLEEAIHKERSFLISILFAMICLIHEASTLTDTVTGTLINCSMKK